MDLERLRELLHMNRSATKALGHDWDVADAMSIVEYWIAEQSMER